VFVECFEEESEDLKLMRRGGNFGEESLPFYVFSETRLDEID